MRASGQDFEDYLHDVAICQEFARKNRETMAARLMSRRAAKNALRMDGCRASMAGICTTSVSQSTLDEAPMAYKSADEIVGAIAGCVDVQEVLKPAFNFKAQD